MCNHILRIYLKKSPLGYHWMKTGTKMEVLNPKLVNNTIPGRSVNQNKPCRV